MTRGQLIQILQKFMPAGSLEYAADLLIRHQIQLHIKKPRATKYGDYRPPLPGEKHRISLNNDLNEYAFLVTFLHEVAHLLNFEKYGTKVSPHGLEWKHQFQRVSIPVFEANILPGDIRNSLGKYLGNPAASSCSDPQLFRTLRKYDNEKQVLVEELPLNTIFRMKDGREFIKLQKNRTRYTCKELRSGRVYLVPGLAACEIVLDK
ncbi:MAG: SprT-like domain-containing protein [Bacteroidia bacterium]|nr:SprT-like domain-containing protein [Bacteroidia bacterium]